MAFVRVARVGDVPAGRGLFVDCGGFPLALFNDGAGRIHALGHLCPHEDGPLAEGWVERGAAVCPWHGFDFDLASGRCLVDEGLAVPVYPVRVVGIDVEVDLP